MKEVTYEEWQKNPTPRMMWVWNSNVGDKVKRKVIYFLVSESHYPVVGLTLNELTAECFRHCAEIEEPKTRRMTNKELSWWLRENPTREYRYPASDYVYSVFDYKYYKQDEEVHADIHIRENGGEWQEPLVEVEE